MLTYSRLLGLFALSIATCNVWAEGEAVTQPHRPTVPALSDRLNPSAMRNVTQWRTLGSIHCPAQDTVNGRTVCRNTATLNFSAEDAALHYVLQVQAPLSHCAPIVYNVVVDNQTQGRFAPAINAGESAYIDLGSGLARGTHRVQIGAMAQVGQGCNQTGLQSWSVKAKVIIQPQ